LIGRASAVLQAEILILRSLATTFSTRREPTFTAGTTTAAATASASP
jgi:hypothetical protein